MQSFEWVDAQSVDHAISLLGAHTEHNRVIAKAGGMDLLDLLKEGIARPTRIINLKTIAAFNAINFNNEQGLRLDALVRLADIASHPIIRERFNALSTAANHAATPQIRNAATIGGNLLQRPRCWYFRNQHFHNDAQTNEQFENEHQYHAIFDNAKSSMVHASTLATALIAYDATVHLTGAQGRTRAIALRDFFLPPSMTSDRDTVINRDELLTHVTIPAPSATTRATYHKQTERDSYDWPLFDIAIALKMNGNIVDDAIVVLGWVAPTPRRATGVEQLLKGKQLTRELAREAAKIATQDATPHTSNAYKIPMVEAVLARQFSGLII